MPSRRSVFIKYFYVRISSHLLCLQKFQTSLEPYFFRMSDENARLVQDLHDEALKKIGG